MDHPASVWAQPPWHMPERSRCRSEVNGTAQDHCWEARSRRHKPLWEWPPPRAGKQKGALASQPAWQKACAGEARGSGVCLPFALVLVSFASEGEAVRIAGGLARLNPVAMCSYPHTGFLPPPSVLRTGFKVNFYFCYLVFTLSFLKMVSSS